MPRAAQDVTNAELSIMQALWADGPSTIRYLTDTLYPDGRPSHYSTVQKLLDRLQKKGLVRKHKGTTRTAQFSPCINKDDLIGRRLRAVADQLCEGSLTPLLTTIVKAQRLTPEELFALRKMIQNLK